MPEADVNMGPSIEKLSEAVQENIRLTNLNSQALMQLTRMCKEAAASGMIVDGVLFLMILGVGFYSYRTRA